MRILACASLAAALVLPACTRPAEPDEDDGDLGFSRQALYATCAKQVEGIGDPGAGWTALKTDGSVWQARDIGLGTVSPAAQVPDLASGVASIGDIDGESLTFCAVKTDGTLWCWGSNTAGQLGDGTMADRDTPMAVQGMTGVAQVATGAEHTCAVKTDGTLWCWGRGAEGQLGDGMMVDRLAPTRVTALSGVAQVSAGWLQTCARTTAGKVYCWGNNQRGEVGDGTAGDVNAADTYKPNPVEVTTLGTTVLSISAGGYFTCAVKTDRSLWCWGDNHSGHLGLGDANDRYLPTRNNTLGTSVAMVDTGVRHGCALKLDGSAWCWGWNEPGHVGNGASGLGTPDVLTPTMVIGQASGGRSIHVVDSGACVVRMDNSVYCWGAGGFLSGGGPATMATEQDWCDLCAPSDCTGNTPQCLNGVCGSCTDDSQCPPATPACAPSGACAQCSPGNTSACPATAPACSAQGTCICMQDWDCGDNPVGMACDDTTHQCRAGCRGVDGTGCPTGLYCSSTTSAIGTCEMAMPQSGGCQCAAPGGRAGAGGRAARLVPLLALGLLAVFRRRRRSW